MKLDLNLCENIIYDKEEGVRVKGVYDLFRYDKGQKTDEIIGVTFRILLESPVFIDVDYVYLKIVGGLKKDYGYLNFAKRYLPNFVGLTGNIYNGKSGVMLSLEADSVDFEEV